MKLKKLSRFSASFVLALTSLMSITMPVAHAVGTVKPSTKSDSSLTLTVTRH